MRKIIERAIIVVFVLVILGVAWWVVDVRMNAPARQDAAFAGVTAQQIRSGEITFKPKYGRYLTLDELVSEGAVPADFQTTNERYKFTIELRETGFVINAEPQGRDAKAFSLDDKGSWSYEP